MPKLTLKDKYDLVSNQATLAEAGGLAKERAILLLWFLRNVVGIGELEAYDHICDGDNDKGIDGMYLIEGPGSQPDILVICQSKYTDHPHGKVGPTDIDRLAGSRIYFESATTLKELIESGAEESLLRLIDNLGILRSVRNEDSPLRVRLALVTTGLLNGDAKRKVNALREAHGDQCIEVWDINRLGPLAQAVRSPDRLQERVSIPVKSDEVLVTGKPRERVAVFPVRAKDVVEWPGIDSRKLFALNVRGELKTNRVSRALDGAIERIEEHRDFLSYHNGLTVVCDHFRRSKTGVALRNPSVVNGAQSVLAFCRADADGVLSDELRVFMKVVEVQTRPLLEKEVGRRSNTQTGVNPRNLMANHGTQLRIQREFERDFPHTIYETRPDTVSPKKHVIKNDEAAQLVCAIYKEWPWLAVKKNSLFESENHSQVFSEAIHAHHIMFADGIKQAIQGQREEFPEPYLSSWLLTRLIAAYLVGQILREAEILVDPLGATAEELGDAQLLDRLTDFAYIAAVAMGERNSEQGSNDDFKRDFKNEGKLRALGAAARKAYRLSAKFDKHKS